jgi:alkanesulfonate monooxygenase SsuD/methylene tetrahydromethanopterin reductase-like flavin-dependent oxidoreductase (luciferase family)
MGVSLNNRAAIFLPDYPLTKLVDAASRAETLGFDAVWVGDSWFDSPRYEPLVTLGAVAVKTSHIRIGTSILQPHLRHPVGLALAWNTLDVLAGGRTIFGVGLGGGTPSGIAKECEVVGIPKQRRGVAFGEAVEVIRKLFTGERTTFHGEFYHLDDVSLPYKPVQRPHPPIWIASGIFHPERTGVAAMPGQYRRREASQYVPQADPVARLGDGWFTIMATPEEYAAALQEIRQRAQAYGRDPEKIVPALEVWININNNAARALAEMRWMIGQYFGGLPVSQGTLERWSVWGSPAACIRRLEDYYQAGTRVMKFVLGSPDPVGMMKRVAQDILSAF